MFHGPWGVSDMPTCSGLGSFSWIIDRDTTETLTVVAGNVSEGLTVPSYRAASPLGDDIPILTPVGMVALTRYVMHRKPRTGSQKKGGRS